MAENDNNTKPGKVVAKHEHAVITKEQALLLMEKILPDVIDVEWGTNPEKGNIAIYQYAANKNGVIRTKRTTQARGFPVTHYAEQWKDIAVVVPALLTLIGRDAMLPEDQRRFTRKEGTSTLAGGTTTFTDNDIDAMLESL